MDFYVNTHARRLKVSLLTHPQHLEPFLPASSPIRGAYSASPLVAPYLVLESRAKALLLASRSEADMPSGVAGMKMSPFDNENLTQFMHYEWWWISLSGLRCHLATCAIGKGDANVSDRALYKDWEGAALQQVFLVFTLSKTTREEKWQWGVVWPSQSSESTLSFRHICYFLCIPSYLSAPRDSKSMCNNSILSI